MKSEEAVAMLASEKSRSVASTLASVASTLAKIFVAAGISRSRGRAFLLV